MKKLIVTCTAVAYAMAFIGCGGGPPETIPEEGGGDEVGDEVGEDGETLSGDGGGDDEEE